MAIRRPPRTRPQSQPTRRTAPPAKSPGATNDQRSSSEAAPIRPAAAAITALEADSERPGAVLIFVPLFVLGFLLVGASAIPPGRVPWPAVAEPLYLHRFDLAAIGIGTVAIALLCLNIVLV